MSIDATKWAWSIQGISASEKLILLSYADRAGETHEAWPSKRRLEVDTCLSPNTIDKTIKSLTAKGFLFRTGETRKQVPVYRLIGVPAREELSTAPNLRGSKVIHSPPQNCPLPPPNIEGSTPPNFGIQNYKKNPKENPKNLRPTFSSFSSLSYFFEYIETAIMDLGLEPAKEVIEQIAFYADKSRGTRDQVESVHMAVNLLKRKQWNIPSGFKGITAKSIREKEEMLQKSKKEQYEDEARAMKIITRRVINSGSSNATGWAEIRKGLGVRRVNDKRLQENVV